MSTLQQYDGKFTIDVLSNDFGVDRNTLALDTGTAYLRGYDGETTDQLMEQFQNAIRTISTEEDWNQASTNVTYDAATGKIRVVLQTYANITFDDVALANILGFSSPTLSNAGEHISDMEARYIWRPSRALTTQPADLNVFFSLRSTSHMSRSKDGHTYGTKGSKLRDGEFGYVNLPEADVIVNDGTNYTPLEVFFEDVAHETQPMRVYPNRDLSTASDYVNAVLVSPDYEDGEAQILGSFENYRSRHIRNYNGLWDVDLYLLKHVT